MSDYILLSDIIEERRVIPVKIETHGVEKEIKVTYNPSKFTPELETQLNRLDEGDEAAEPILKMLTVLIIDWNVMLPPDPESGEPDQPRPYPPTLDNLRRVPYSLLGALVRAVSQDIAPKEPSARR